MSKIFELLEKYGGAPPENKGIYLGKIIAIPSLGGDEIFNFTLPKGEGTNLWMGFLPWLNNSGYIVQKVDESLEISPVDAGYYQLTQKQKEEMEIKIKQGLASIATAVSEYELLAHDLRKYKEFLKMLETNDEHSLRSIFIDEVDIATGANSIKQIVIRWPTMIADFMTLGEKIPEETDVEKIRKILNISKAEAVVLSTKQRLYNNWKEIFGSEVRGRVKRILAQVKSREKSISEYKSWLKPLIARHKLYKEGLSKPETIKGTLTSIWHSPGQAISTNIIEIWAWQPMVGIEARAGTLEIRGNVAIEPYDSLTKEKIIFNEENGLKKYYPWITEEWVNSKVKEIISNGWLTKNRLYYVFFQIIYERAIIKTPTGFEMEDITFNTKTWFLSQNALLVLLLDLKAKQEVFEKEIDQLIGLTSKEETIDDELEKIIERWKSEKKRGIKKKDSKLKKVRKKINKILEILGIDSQLAKFGPYEHNFKDRITNIYLAICMRDFYVPHVVKYLLDKAGVGK